MNILITLPRNLVEKIISGEKKFEMRKCVPREMKLGVDGFFVVEKGTDAVRCWCRVDGYEETFIDHYSAKWWGPVLCVSSEVVEKYAYNQRAFAWKIGKVITLESIKRDSLLVDRNPQQFAYCPLSLWRILLFNRNFIDRRE